MVDLEDLMGVWRLRNAVVLPRVIQHDVDTNTRAGANLSVTLSYATCGAKNSETIAYLFLMYVDCQLY